MSSILPYPLWIVHMYFSLTFFFFFVSWLPFGPYVSEDCLWKGYFDVLLLILTSACLYEKFAPSFTRSLQRYSYTLLEAFKHCKRKATVLLQGKHSVSFISNIYYTETMLGLYTFFCPSICTLQYVLCLLPRKHLSKCLPGLFGPHSSLPFSLRAHPQRLLPLPLCTTRTMAC